MTTVTVVLLAWDGGVALARTLDSIDRQRCGSLIVDLVVAAQSKGAHNVDAIAAVARPRRARFVECDPATGATLNRCLAAAAGPFAIVLDEGDQLPDGALAAGAAVLETGARVTAFPWALTAGFDRVETVTPTALSQVHALATPDRAPTVFLFARDEWERVGGFDGRLQALVEYDLYLRLCEDRPVAVLDGYPIRRHLATGSRLRRELDPATHLEALAVVLAKHRALLEGDPATFLVSRERESAALLARHRALVARRDDAVSRTRAAREKTLGLRGFLRGHGRDVVDWGELRHTAPLSREWGYDRGTPLDRVFIERFIADHSADLRGRVLEVQENDLTRRFGGPAVAASDVVDVTLRNERANVIADLRCASGIPDDTYDCIVLTQTLHVIDDMGAVLRECRRILTDGGVLLATFPAASRVCVEYGPDGDFWRTTEAGARRLCASVFGEAAVEATSYGNVLTTTAFLQGAAAHELAPAEFEASDPAHPTLIAVRAVKTDAPPAQHGHGKRRAVARGRAVVLLYHRVATLDEDLHRLAVPPEEFARQIALVASRYLPVALGDLIDAGVQRRLPHRAVAVTFDDGYADNLLNAAPILAAHQVPAAFFIPTAFVHRPSEFWWDTLARVLGADRSLHDDTYRRLVRGTREEIDRTIEELCLTRGAVRGPAQVMSKEQLLELAAAALHTVGAHGLNHLYLPSQSRRAQYEELFDSRRAIEDLLGRAVRWVAYPFGAYDSATCDAARAAGYDGALTCDARPWAEAENPYRIPRVEVRSQSIDDFEALLSDVLEDHHGC